MKTTRFKTQIGDENLIRPPGGTRLPPGPAEVTVVSGLEENEPAKGKPVFGSARGKIHMSDDFGEPLEDFTEY